LEITYVKMPRAVVSKDELEAKLKEIGKNPLKTEMKFSPQSGDEPTATPSATRCWVLDEVDWYIFTGPSARPSTGPQCLNSLL